MKRADLLKTMRKAAAAAGVEFELDREGAAHSIYRYDGQRVTIPRHRELNEITAREILKQVGL